MFQIYGFGSEVQFLGVLGGGQRFRDLSPQRVLGLGFGFAIQR